MTPNQIGSKPEFLDHGKDDRHGEDDRGERIRGHPSTRLLIMISAEHAVAPEPESGEELPYLLRALGEQVRKYRDRMAPTVARESPAALSWQCVVGFRLSSQRPEDALPENAPAQLA
jgi:hypothetical protein